MTASESRQLDGVASARQSMNKPLTGLFCLLHTIRHINKFGLALIGLVEIVWM
jgi:hypothetical protein